MEDRRKWASEASKIDPVFWGHAGKMAALIAGVTFGCFLGAVRLGQWLDGRAGSAPLLTILMGLGGIGVSLYLNVKIAFRTIAAMKLKGNPPAKTRLADGERDSDDD